MSLLLAAGVISLPEGNDANGISNSRRKNSRINLRSIKYGTRVNKTT